MTIKRIIPIVLLLGMLVILTGCGADSLQNSAIVSEKPTPTSFLDFLHAELSPGSFTSHGLDNRTLSEEECRLRRVINSGSMYQEIKGQEYEVEVDGEKYGIADFARNDDWYNFINISDMVTVFKNVNFQQDFYDLYSYNLGLDAYYLPSQTLIEKYNTTESPSNLVVWDEDYNLSTGMSGYKDHSYILCDMFYTRNEVDLEALMDFYVGIDGLELNSAISSNGTDIYYIYAEDGCVLFEDAGLQTNRPTTGYIWKQDNVISVFILPGEFSEENLDLCVLEKHEI